MARKKKAGDEFTYYIVDRTKRFLLLGQRVYAHLEQRVGASALELWAEQRRARASVTDLLPPRLVDGASLRGSLEAALRLEPEIGPTMTKMFLVRESSVSTSARYLEY